MTREELVRTLIAEIKKYPGFDTEVIRVGEYESIRITRGQCVYDMLVHPMLELRFIELIKMILDCVAMYAARLEVVQNAV